MTKKFKPSTFRKTQNEHREHVEVQSTAKLIKGFALMALLAMGLFGYNFIQGFIVSEKAKRLEQANLAPASRNLDPKDFGQPGVHHDMVDYVRLPYGADAKDQITRYRRTLSVLLACPNDGREIADEYKAANKAALKEIIALKKQLDAEQANRVRAGLDDSKSMEASSSYFNSLKSMRETLRSSKPYRGVISPWECEAVTSKAARGALNIKRPRMRHP
jgi:hypothetical protein